jgi:hypothetical protein
MACARTTGDMPSVRQIEQQITSTSDLRRKSMRMKISLGGGL